MLIGKLVVPCLVGFMVLSLAAPGSSDAQILSLEFRGTVSQVDNPGGLPLDSSVFVSAPITAVFTFDTTVPDDNADPNVGVYNYNYDANNTGRVFAMTWTVGNYTFSSQSGPFGNEGSLGITDSNTLNVIDWYLLSGTGLAPDGGIQPYAGICQLIGPYTAMAGTGADIVPDPNDFYMSAFPDRRNMIMSLTTENYNPLNPIEGLAIIGYIDEVVVVPEPASLSVLVIGALAMLRRKKMFRRAA